MEKGYLKIEISFEYKEDDASSHTSIEGININREDTAYALSSLVNEMSKRFKHPEKFREEFILSLIGEE